MISIFFKSFSQSLEQFFLTLGQNNFGNKIHFFFFLLAEEFNYDYCPHKAVLEMEPVMYPEQAKDQVIHQKSYNICGNHFVRFNRKVKSAFLSLQLTLMTLQAKLGYVLIGILGEKCLRQYGYPHICVLRILHHILDMAGVKVRILKSSI